jgi:multidrug efflux system outer membrane protein
MCWFIVPSENTGGVSGLNGLKKARPGAEDMKRVLFFLLSLTFFWGGCTLAPEYSQPETPVPAVWPTGDAYKYRENISGAAAPIELPWREFFTDKNLQRIIETALKNNRDLRIAALNVQRARAIYGIQRAELYPAVNTVAGGSKQRIPADLSAGGQATIREQYDVNLGIAAWEIDFFGRIRSLKDRALEEYMATQQARRSAQILTVSEVTRSYLVMAADQETLNLAKTTHETQKKAYHLVRRRYEVGIATELDLRRAQTQVDIARRDIALYTQRVAQDRNLLEFLTGSVVPRESLPTGQSSVAMPNEISPGLSSEVLLQRPDIMLAEHRLKGANANIGAARAALFPRISLTTSVGTASNELSGLFDSGSGTWSFAAQGMLPIFDARLWSALDVVKAEREISLTQYEKAIQTAFREVADALAVRGTVEEQLAAQQSLVNAAAETFRITKARYTKGIDSYLSVLDAQRSLYAAQQVLVTLNLEKHINQVQVYAVLGGGAD